MLIYIPSRGRAANQITLKALPATTLSKVRLVVNAAEYSQYAGLGVPVLQVPVSLDTIGKKRAWILAQHDVSRYGAKILMLDDDLIFAVRRIDDLTKFRPAAEEDVLNMLRAIEHNLDDYSHVSVCSREGGNRHISGPLIASRAMRVLGYDARVLNRLKVDFARADVMCDFDVTLQLLRHGLPNIVLTAWCQDDAGGSNAPGGCSLYRDSAVQSAAANRLATLHPKYVSVVEKRTKHNWQGQARLDVKIMWKKALKEAAK